MSYANERSDRKGALEFLMGTQRRKSEKSMRSDAIPVPEATRAQIPIPIVDPTPTNIVQEEFDEYGAELEPEARVWKTYVEETNRFDLERFDQWNLDELTAAHWTRQSSLQATFFAATCTAFLVESSKSLKENPAETSARRLDQIAIILAMANTGDPLALNSTEVVAPKSFSPRPIDIWINVLWSFSLITSAAVPPIAMLAKDWCYSYMSGRIGDPWSQTRRRQLRWSGIKKWKMEQFITFLPSLIHLAFLSFAIGLSLYLWDLNVGVAIPAVVITFGSIFVYLISTLLPLSDALCPYGTPVSTFVQRFSKRIISARSYFDSRIAVEALAWLIESSADPKSKDIALQAIAGADADDVDATTAWTLLKQSGVDTLIFRRLIGLDSYTRNYYELSDLYTRAQVFLQSQFQTIGLHASSEKKGVINPNQEVRKGSSVRPQRGLNRGLQKKIRELRVMVNKEITTYITYSPHVFIPTFDNTQALRIGSTAASHCLRILQHGLQFETQELFDSAIELLDNYRNGSAYLNDREIHYLMIGTAMLLSSLLIKCPADFGARYVMRLLRIANRAGDGQRQLRLEYLSLPLVVYALSQHDYPGWTQPPPLSPTSRTERAIEVITHYAANRDGLSRDSPFMINLALLELISNPEGYNLDGDDIVAISEAFAPTLNGQTRIYTFPEYTLHDSFSSSVKSADKVISNGRSGPLGKDAITIACLTVLNRTGMDQKVNDPPLGEVYAFVVECVLTLSYSGPEAYGPNTALNLMQKFHDSEHPGRIQNLMPNLAQSLDKRGTFAQLKRATKLQATEEGSNFVIKLFATGQAWFFIDLVIKSKVTDNEDWRRCLSLFVEDDNLWDSPEHAMRVLGECRSNLAEQYRAMWTKYVTGRHEYFRILLDSLT